MLSLRKEAESDIEEAYRYYEGIRAGLGADFLLCVEEALTRIERNPAQFQLVHRRVARAVLHRFPYSVFFTVVGPAIIVTAVMHVRRNPSRWRTRG